MLVSLPSDGIGQAIPCGADLKDFMSLPEIRTSAAKAALRVAPESDAKAVVTLPPDIELSLLDQSGEWLAVGYRDRNGYRRLYLSSQDAEDPAAAGLGPRQIQAQKWATAHAKGCEEIARQNFAAKSFAVASVVAGLTSIIWHVYVDDDDHYGTAFAVWTGISAASLVGTVYKALLLRRARGELTNLGGPPSFAHAGAPPGPGGAGVDLRFDAGTGRVAIVATWRP